MLHTHEIANFPISAHYKSLPQDFFLFLHLFFHDFPKKYSGSKHLQKLPPSAMVKGGRDLPPPGTAVGAL
jgi:hypothetical protein